MPEKQTFTVTIASAPRGKQRPRFTAPRPGQTPRAYTPKETVNAEAWIRLCCVQQVGTPCLTVPVRVRIEAVVPVPAGMSRMDKARAAVGEKHPTGKPDLDNMAKLVLDALNGIAWSDDAKVIELVAVKRYGAVPCTVVSWGPMPAGGLAAGLL